MRLWSIHPKYLDSKGLVALWREGLLAQKVLFGETKGYINHPQLIRFRNTSNPKLYIGTYLYYVYLEGLKRGYSFNLKKIRVYDLEIEKIPVTIGQLRYEYTHLMKKLMKRAPDHYEKLKSILEPEAHPIFTIIPGKVESWEKTKVK